MPRRGFAGGAVPTTLAGPLSAGAMSFSITKTDGWVFTTLPFVVVVDRGVAAEEKILCASISGPNITVALNGRGYDGTTPKSHDPGAAVHHVLSSDVVDEANAHANDHIGDVHPQYLMDGDIPATSYRHEQSIPSATWVIPHNLGFRPNVSVFDSAGRLVEGDVTHNSPNQVTVTFAAAFGGEASLS